MEASCGPLVAIVVVMVLVILTVGITILAMGVITVVGAILRVRMTRLLLGNILFAEPFGAHFLGIGRLELDFFLGLRSPGLGSRAGLGRRLRRGSTRPAAGGDNEQGQKH
jgi:hypothetical protein